MYAVEPGGTALLVSVLTNWVPVTVLGAPVPPFASKSAITAGKLSAQRAGHRVQPAAVINFSMVEYINNHYKEDLNLNSLSSALYMSRNKVSDLFKTYAGISVNDYINTLRIRSANSLLKDGVSISEAAFSSGFGCIRTFNNVYKNITGLSPTEFLNK